MPARLLRPAALTGLALAASLSLPMTGAPAAPTAAPRPAAPRPAKPRAVTMTPYLPTGTAAHWAWRRATNATDRQLFGQIGATASAVWFDGSSAADEARLKRVVDKAAQQGRAAQLVLYGIPRRDCGSLSAGGHRTAASYRAWIARVSRTVGTRHVVVVVEPDAIGFCGSKAVRAQRAPLLAFVGSTFKRNNPNAVLYLHMGSGQLDPARASSAARASGIGSMRGFALNVASHKSTASQQAWGERFVARLARDGVRDRHYVVDTSRNGRGLPPNRGARYPSCNNFGVAPGTRPTARTSAAHADAYLWVKPVGESDGVCRPGQPKAGAWYPQLARQVVRNGWAAGTIARMALPR